MHQVTYKLLELFIFLFSIIISAKILIEKKILGKEISMPEPLQFDELVIRSLGTVGLDLRFLRCLFMHQLCECTIMYM